MIIGLSSGNFHRIYPETENNSLLRGFESWKKEYGNAIEIHCPNEKVIDYFLDKNFNLSSFEFISVHAPNISQKKDRDVVKLLSKLEAVKEKYRISNFVFHIEEGVNFDLLSNAAIPVSIENMDANKSTGRFVNEIKDVILKYNFNITLDLQHCYTNDKSMKLAQHFHSEFFEKIAEYHISGFKVKHSHAPLFLTKQDNIIHSVAKKNIPIIIESTFDKLIDAEKELEYIKKRL